MKLKYVNASAEQGKYWGWWYYYYYYYFEKVMPHSPASGRDFQSSSPHPPPPHLQWAALPLFPWDDLLTEGPLLSWRQPSCFLSLWPLVCFEVILFNMFPELKWNAVIFATQLRIDSLLVKPISCWRSLCPGARSGTAIIEKLIFHDVLLDNISYPSLAFRPPKMPVEDHCVLLFKKPEGRSEKNARVGKWPCREFQGNKCP